MRNLFPKISLLFISLVLLANTRSAYACYATFNHTNACAGDTVWFYALDLYAVQAWDFGDSTLGNPNMTFGDTAFHVYNTPGTYYVTHFVNIGAEWAYETQEITVGTDCFEAAFDANCNGLLYETFVNQSVGDNLNYQWDFGDPASGIANTDTTANPYHFFTLSGNYTVTLIINDGVQSDTAIQTVSVDSACMSVYVSYYMNACAGDTTFYNYSFSGVTSVEWDFGDPGSGADNYSTSFNPNHIFSAPGVYIGSVIYSNGVDSDTLPVISYVLDCDVWPGDGNRDGRVSGEDLFPIGLYYGDTGPSRTGGSINFMGQSMAEWNPGNPFMDMYLQDMVNKKYADCNGDGTIDQLDVEAITQNFGMTHLMHNSKSTMQLIPPTAPHLSISAPAQLNAGNSGDAMVDLGSVYFPALGTYGYCATIAYDNSAIDASSITVDFSGLWLDSTVQQSNSISFFHNDPANGLLTIATVRTNKMSIDGYGHVATVHFTLKNTFSGQTTFHILPDAKLVSNTVFGSAGQGQVQNYRKMRLDDAMVDVVAGVNDVDATNSISVFPNPATNQVELNLGSQTGHSFAELYDVTGKEIMTFVIAGNQYSINTSALQSGCYLLKVSNENFTSFSKIMIER